MRLANGTSFSSTTETFVIVCAFDVFIRFAFFVWSDLIFFNSNSYPSSLEQVSSRISNTVDQSRNRLKYFQSRATKTSSRCLSEWSEISSLTKSPAQPVRHRYSSWLDWAGPFRPEVWCGLRLVRYVLNIFVSKNSYRGILAKHGPTQSIWNSGS